MDTLLEFLYSVKSVEYLIAIGFIVTFLLYWRLWTAAKPAEPPVQGLSKKPRH
ncbi:MAG: hypothetical protein Q7O66_16185 [Dehalococcoidia bacterium]|nr:hypothetical protein [Dehalococcoidia bacterium]